MKINRYFKIVIICIVGLTGLIFITIKNNATQKIAPDKILETIQQGFQVKGMITLDKVSETVYPSRITFHQAKVTLQLANNTSFDFAMRKNVVMVEAGQGGSLDGDIVFFGLKKHSVEDNAISDISIPRSYGVSNSEIRYIDGSGFVGGNIFSLLWVNTAVSEDDIYDDFIPNSISGQEKTSLYLTLNRGLWIKNETRTGLVLALPEVYVESFQSSVRIVIHFKRESDDGKTWIVEKSEVIPLEKTELLRVLNTPDVNPAIRLLAFNWLAEIDIVALVSFAQSLNEGNLLFRSFRLLEKTENNDLISHANKLVEVSDTPLGICIAAIEYLVSVNREPDLSSLIALADGKDEDVTKDIINALGRIKTLQAVEGLLTLLKNPDLNSFRSNIVKQFQETDQPIIIEPLKSLIAEDNQEALEALSKNNLPECADFFKELIQTEKREYWKKLAMEGLRRSSGAKAFPLLRELADNGNQEAMRVLTEIEECPSCFDYFAEIARNDKREDWRRLAVRGIKQSGGENALPVLLELLQNEPPPENAWSKSSVVGQLIELNSTKIVPELARLAENGNLPALQVLAGYEDKSAHPLLIKIANSAEGFQRRLALNSLIDHWAEQSIDPFKMALKSDDKEVVALAIKGLRKNGTVESVSLLLPLLANEEYRDKAADAIKVLPIGSHASEILEAILSTDSPNVAEDFTISLIRNQWKVPEKAISRLRNKLEKSDEPKMNYQIIRLFRYFSFYIMGPQTYNEYKYGDEGSDYWDNKYLEWAAKQS